MPSDVTLWFKDSYNIQIVHGRAVNQTITIICFEYEFIQIASNSLLSVLKADCISIYINKILKSVYIVAADLKLSGLKKVRCGDRPPSRVFKTEELHISLLMVWNVC